MLHRLVPTGSMLGEWHTFVAASQLHVAVVGVGFPSTWLAGSWIGTSDTQSCGAVRDPGFFASLCWAVQLSRHWRRPPPTIPPAQEALMNVLAAVLVLGAGREVARPCEQEGYSDEKIRERTGLSMRLSTDRILYVYTTHTRDPSFIHPPFSPAFSVPLIPKSLIVGAQSRAEEHSVWRGRSWNRPEGQSVHSEGWESVFPE